jgi:hypothetical protein
MKARFLLMGYAAFVLPAFAMPFTHVEPGQGNAGPLILAHDHWINNKGYKSESGVHCCDHRASGGDCDEIDPDTVKPMPDGRGYMTPKGRVSGRSTYISEDGKTYLCSPPQGPPRCLFIRSGG